MKQTSTWRDQLGPDRLETGFVDFKEALDQVDAETEANRCINCYDAPCIQACPTQINIPRFISRIATGNTSGAARTILDSNIFGLSCARSCPTEVLCEGACVYNHLNKKPIMIGKLQRYATEFAYDRDLEFFSPGKSSGKKVALVGGGPASLACAHELRRHGHEAVIFEKNQIPGGLNTTGIAPYKMKADVSLREIERIARMGVKFEYGKELGRNLKLEDLASEYDAVFLGLGLGPDSRLDVIGKDHPSIRGAVEFIAELKTKSGAQIKGLKTALVVGGGNTALDACRELKGLGVPRVIVSYRRGAEAMSGYKHELKCAMQEGVEFWFHTLPTAFESSPTGVHAKIQETVTEANGKVVARGATRELDAGLVLMATGQSKLEVLLKSVSGLSFEGGKLKVDPATGRTGNPRIFAGGDLSNGGMEVVNAVAEGKRAALAMHRGFEHG
jgi:dihydropyrimidine dehydrogenase (NAD+) subunit PreT